MFSTLPLQRLTEAKLPDQGNCSFHNISIEIYAVTPVRPYDGADIYLVNIFSPASYI